MSTRNFLPGHLVTSALTLALPLIPLASFAQNQLQIIFQVDKPDVNNNFNAILKVKNDSNQAISNWQVGLSSSSYIWDVVDAKINNPIGDLFIITPTNPSIQTIQAHSEVNLHLRGPGNIVNLSYAPRGFFLIVKDPVTNKEFTLDPDYQKTRLLPYKPTAANDDYTRNLQHNQASIEGNPVQPTFTAEEALIVPLPAELKRASGQFNLKSDTLILIDKNSMDAIPAADFFSRSITPATGFSLAQKIADGNTTAKNTIVFSKPKDDTQINKEGYRLEINPDNITVMANDKAGFFYAVQSLRQLLPAAIFSQKISQTNWNFPALTINDYPRFSYRGLHLDVARHFVPKDQVKRLLDLMALHKLNVFHWHLTDDEGWRIEIKRYPNLTANGAWRGYNRDLKPSFGSGGGIYGGYYTQDDVREIVSYASARNITIIPEIDIPGHSRALIMGVKDQLIDQTDKSVYTSAQGYHDNVLTPCLDSTFVVLDNIMTEVASLFPGNYIHIGADEVPNGVWTKSEFCRTKFGDKPKREVENYFLQRVQAIIESKNKQLAGWQEIADANGMHLTSLVYSWTGEDAGYRAAQRGYPVVMVPAQYLYFDMGYNQDPKERGYFWAGAVDTFKTYSYSPIPTSWPRQVGDQIRGIEGALWSENLDSQSVIDYMTFPRLLSLAEVAWTPAKRRNWINFSERLGKLHLPRLDAYGVNYRLGLPGIDLSSLVQGKLLANIEFPGMTMRYTTNGEKPSAQSTEYTAPVTGINNVKIRSFSQNNRHSRTAKGG